MDDAMERQKEPGKLMKDPRSHCLSPGLLTSGLVTKKSKTVFG